MSTVIWNYFTIAVRNLVRNRLYSIISIMGLAIGLAGCLLIVGYVSHERSFENCHHNRDRIYRVDGYYVIGDSRVSMANISAPVGPALKEAFPEVEKMTRFRRMWDADVEIRDNLIVTESKLLVTDPEILQIFTIPLTEGSPETALEAPYSIIISEQIADKYFEGQSPLGHTVKVNDQHECQITGVFESLPANTQLHTNFFLSYSTLKNMEVDLENWDDILNDYTYLLLRENTDPAQLEQKIPALLEQHMGEDAKTFQLQLQPLKRIYLHSHLSYELPPHGNLDYIYIFSCVAVVILVIASINFINLTTARTSHRMKEVGVRKVLGAFRRQLVIQFLGESVLITMVSMVLGIVLFEFALPQLEAFLGRDLAIDIYRNPIILLSILAMIVVVGVLSGSYPALMLAKHRPTVVLRGGTTGKTFKPTLRRILVAFQFTIAIVLVCVTFIIYRQIQYANTKDLGFDKEDVLLLYSDEEIAPEKLQLVKQEILSNTTALSATALKVPPGGGNYVLYAVRPENSMEEEPILLSMFYVDYDFLSTFKIDLLQGRNFSEEYTQSDESTSIIINQAAIDEFNIDNPIGFKFLATTKEFNVVGVVNDFHNVTLRNQIPPLALRIKHDSNTMLAVKLPPNSQSAAISQIEDTWNRLLPECPLEYKFLGEHLREDYQGDQKMGALFTGFSLLAIFVGCLGLFGLAAFMAEKRTKEIGIRKVLGATVSNIVQLLFKEFLVLVAIASAIACPLAYYLGDMWLESFSYKTHLSWTIFVLSGMLVLAVALMTVSYQAFRAAIANPVDALRYE
jgi:putative ABC transport system permease protein